MFKNLQLFEGLSDKEIITALRLVLTEEKRLIVMLPHNRWVSLIPYELDKDWTLRMSDALEPLTISNEELGPWDSYEGCPPPFHDYLYEQNGLNKLLNPYSYKPDLYWVCGGKELAIETISDFNGKFDSNFTTIRYLVDGRGTKFEVLERELFTNKAKTRRAFELSHYAAQTKCFGIADPIPDFEYRKGGFPIDTPEFAAVIQVWEKYWKDGSGMTKDAIVAELMADGFSQKRAEAIELICRPTDRRLGGHKKKK